MRAHLITNRGQSLLSLTFGVALAAFAMFAMMQVSILFLKSQNDVTAALDLDQRIMITLSALESANGCQTHFQGVRIDPASQANAMALTLFGKGAAPIVAPNLGLNGGDITESSIKVTSVDQGGERYFATWHIVFTKKEGTYTGAPVLERNIPLWIVLTGATGNKVISDCGVSTLSGTAALPPTNCAVVHTANSKNFSVGWTGGKGNGGAGGCKIQYYKNSSTWVDLPGSSENCDADLDRTSGPAVRTLPADGWNGSWNSVSPILRLVSSTSRTYMCTLGVVTCTSVATPTSGHTTSIDENCNGFWDDEYPPSGFWSTHPVNTRGMMLGWNTAGSFNGGPNGCRFEYRDSAHVWRTLGLGNCDSVLQPAVNNFFFPTTTGWYGANWSSVPVRVVRVSDSAVLNNYPGMQCSSTNGSVIPTPDKDEDCNNNWDNVTYSPLRYR